MDRGRDKLPNTTSRLIAMAVTLVGSAQVVRERMGCEVDDFVDYRAGKKEPDWVQFGRLVELIIAEQRKVITANRTALDTISSRKRR